MPDHEHNKQTKACTSSRRQATAALARAPPRKQHAAFSSHGRKYGPTPRDAPAATDNTPTKRLVVKLKPRTTALPAHQQCDNKQLLKQSCDTSAAATFHVCHTPAAAAAAAASTCQIQPAENRNKSFRAAPVERPVTRRFKLQQSSKIRVHLKLKAPLGKSASRSRLSTLRHQQKRQTYEHKPHTQQENSTEHSMTMPDAPQASAAASPSDSELPSTATSPVQMVSCQQKPAAVRTKAAVEVEGEPTSMVVPRLPSASKLVTHLPSSCSALPQQTSPAVTGCLPINSGDLVTLLPSPFQDSHCVNSSNANRPPANGPAARSPVRYPAAIKGPFANGPPANGPIASKPAGSTAAHSHTVRGFDMKDSIARMAADKCVLHCAAPQSRLAESSLAVSCPAEPSVRYGLVLHANSPQRAASKFRPIACG